MSVCCLVAGTASDNSSKCSTGSEMGSVKPLASYCPQVLTGKAGNKEQYYTKMWWQELTKDGEGKVLNARFASIFTDMFFSQVCQELNNSQCN